MSVVVGGGSTSGFRGRGTFSSGRWNMEEEDEKLMEKYALIEANYQKRLRQAIRRMDWHSSTRRKADREAHGDGIVGRAS